MEMRDGNITVCCIDSSSSEESYRGLYEAIDTADYIAIDLEMSGIGSKSSLRATSVEDRYQNLCQTATSHSILSMGVACFRSPPIKSLCNGGVSLPLECAVFDLVLFSETPYMVNPKAIDFLCDNGFDFNHQYHHGLRYTPSFITDQSVSGTSQHSARRIFLNILNTRKPLIFHNGFIDLVFLYSHFYTAPPTNLGTFTADLFEMLSGGIYDTKHIPLSDTLMLPSYLNYLLYYSWHQNYINASKHLNHIKLMISPISHYPTVTIKIVERMSCSPTGSILAVCESYAEYGFCRNSSTCTKSHNIAHVMAAEWNLQEDISTDGGTNGDKKLKKTKKKRKRQRNSRKLNDSSLTKMFSRELDEAKRKLATRNEIPVEQNSIQENTSDYSNDHMMEVGTKSLPGIDKEATLDTSHSIGLPIIDIDAGLTCDSTLDTTALPETTHSHKSSRDAFATGFYFLQSALSRLPASATQQELSMNKLLSLHEEYKNKVAINGKPMPLLITKSYYSATSDNHRRMKQYLLL